MCIRDRYIPTYKRVGKQKTFFNLPEKYQKIATLVVREEEAELHGELPITNIDREVTTNAETRKWKANHNYLVTSRFYVF